MSICSSRSSALGVRSQRSVLSQISSSAPPRSFSHTAHGRRFCSRPSTANRRPSVGVNAIFKAIGDVFNQGKLKYTLQQAGEYDAPSIQNKLQSYIKDNKVAVFSWTGCPYCKRAKALLDEVGAKYTPIELDLMGDEGKALRAELAKMTGRTSVPAIFIAKEYVGGCNDGPGIATLNVQGQLVPKLQAAGAL